MTLTIRRGDLAHMALLLWSLALAYVLPFELLLLAYIVLGPAHYYTEISWLHDRSYFMPHRALAIALPLAAPHRHAGDRRRGAHPARGRGRIALRADRGAAADLHPRLDLHAGLYGFGRPACAQRSAVRARRRLSARQRGDPDRAAVRAQLRAGVREARRILFRPRRADARRHV